MCGIAGIVSLNKSLVNEQSLKKMADSIAHRGPDGEGYFINPNGTVGFVHRRLSIIDLSAAAAQPMHYLQRYTIVYNGEIYNYKELKITLQKAGYSFNNESDTEVILAAYDLYKEDCVQNFDGMFAFAIWDEVEQNIFCARDIFGEKPFYFFRQNDAVYFASEMKALWAIGIDKTPDDNMMAEYLGIGQVQNPKNKAQTFYKNIFSLPAAHCVSFKVGQSSFELKRYFDVDKENQIDISENNAIDKIESLLTESIQKRLRSDVPVGSSLSGGIDSSTIAYFISKQNDVKSFKTFSAVFPNFEKDESQFIQELCKSLQFENKTVTPTAADFIANFEKCAYQQEEPFTSASIFAQYKVYELAAANKIKVLLDGQGADEIFGGYGKYINWYLQDVLKNKGWASFKKESAFFEKQGLSKTPNYKNFLAAYLPSYTAALLTDNAKNKIQKNKFINADFLVNVQAKTFVYKPTVTKLNDILYHNTMELGLEELLRFADRNSMANGVEVRLPFLNKELVQFIFSLPTVLKMQAGFTKYIFRKTMQDKLPNKVLWNPIKIGFEPPQKSWMENETVMDMIQEAKKKLVEHKILNKNVLTQKIIASDANDGQSTDWRILSLAQVIK
jgi:asparagine synthase (glutamine-hydrolysing)